MPRSRNSCSRPAITSSRRPSRARPGRAATRSRWPAAGAPARRRRRHPPRRPGARRRPRPRRGGAAGRRGWCWAPGVGLSDTIVLDKTGTLTTGVMAVTGIQPAPGTSRGELLRRLGGVEDASGHPVAAAVSAAARAELGELPRASGFVSLPGLGARGIIDGQEVIAGRDSCSATAGSRSPPGRAVRPVGARGPHRGAAPAGAARPAARSRSPTRSRPPPPRRCRAARARAAHGAADRGQPAVAARSRPTRGR